MLLQAISVKKLKSLSFITQFHIKPPALHKEAIKIEI